MRNKDYALAISGFDPARRFGFRASMVRMAENSTHKKFSPVSQFFVLLTHKTRDECVTFWEPGKRQVWTKMGKKREKVGEICRPDQVRGILGRPQKLFQSWFSRKSPHYTKRYLLENATTKS